MRKEKHDMVESEAQKSPCAQRFLRSTSNSASSTPNGHLSSSEDNIEPKCIENANEPKVERKSLVENNGKEKQTNSETDVAKKRVTIAKNSITPPVSSSNTPQRVRRSQSLSSTRSTGITEFEKSCLKAHNEYRAKHSVPPLKLNKRLCRFSEEWAKVNYSKPFLSKHVTLIIAFAYRYLRLEEHQSIATIHHTGKIYSVHGAQFRIWLSKGGNQSNIGTVKM